MTMVNHRGDLWCPQDPTWSDDAYERSRERGKLRAQLDRAIEVTARKDDEIQELRSNMNKLIKIVAAQQVQLDSHRNTVSVDHLTEVFGKLEVSEAVGELDVSLLEGLFDE